MSPSSLDTLRDLCLNWNVPLEDVRPAELEEALTAIGAAIAADKATELRAAQTVLLGDRGDSVRKREAVRLLGAKAGPLARDVLLLRALVVAGWPEGAGKVAGLMEAGWEVRTEEERFREGIEGWRGGMSVASDLGEEVGGIEVPGWPTIEDIATREELGTWQVRSDEFREAWEYLVARRGQGGLNFKAFGAQLVCVLSAMIADLETILRRDGQIGPNAGADQSNIAWLRSNQDQSWTYNQFAPKLLGALQQVETLATSLGRPPTLRGEFFNHLNANAGAGWNYEAFSVQLLAILGAYRGELLRDEATAASQSAIEDLSTTLTSQESRLQTYTTTLSTSLQSRLTALDAHVRAARPAELDLLWWGQARYCKTEQTPYRKLRDPEQILWRAASEAAGYAIPLPPAPAAAFLVETLASLKQDVDEKRTVIDWMTATYDLLRKLPSEPVREPLATLASSDPAGLPVTFLRLAAAAGRPPTPDILRDRVVVDPDAQIDRGDWATWIFREHVLEQRLA